MLNRTLMVACLFAALAACDRPQEPLKAGPAAQDVAPGASEQKTISAMPEHFDRVRAEQFEKEEERLRRRGR
jgi:predicted small lipoprotein YifL